MARLILTISLWLATTVASAAGVVLQKDQRSVNLTHGLSHWEVDLNAGSLDTQKIIHGGYDKAFTPVFEDTVSMGFNPNGHWFKTTLFYQAEGTNNKEWILEVGYPLLDHVEIYLVNSDLTFEKTVGGNDHPISSRPIQHRNLMVPITMQPNESKNVYFFVKSNSSIKMPLVVWSRNALFNKVSNYHLLLGSMIGIIIAMIIYHLFLYVFSRKRIYSTYMAFTCAAITFLATYNGFT